jgi:hypothetical protein
MIAPVLDKPELISRAPEHEPYIFHAIIIVVLSRPELPSAAAVIINLFLYIFFQRKSRGKPAVSRDRQRRIIALPQLHIIF